MVIDVIGSNCSGKSTLIRELVEQKKVTHLALDEKAYPPGCRTSYGQYRTILTRPHAAQTLAGILKLGEWQLARRYRKYFFHQVMLLQRAHSGTMTVATDEGVVKKLYEAVPFLTAENHRRELSRWITFNRRVGPDLLKSISPLVDLLMYVFVEPDEYLARVHQRKFFAGEHPDHQILRRYQVQCEIYKDLLERARALGMPVCEIRSGDPLMASGELFAGLRS